MKYVHKGKGKHSVSLHLERIKDMVQTFPHLKLVTTNFDSLKAGIVPQVCFKCNQCNEAFTKNATCMRHLLGTTEGCPKCNKQSQVDNMAATKTLLGDKNRKEHVAYLKIHRPHLRVLSHITSGPHKTKSKIKCKTCGNVFLAHVKRIALIVKRGKRKGFNGCSKCGAAKGAITAALGRAAAGKIAFKSFIKNAKQRLLDFPNIELVKCLPLQEGTNKPKFRLRCTTHNTTWDAYYSALMGYVNSGCKACASHNVATNQLALKLNYHKRRLVQYQRLKLVTTPDTLHCVCKFKCLECHKIFKGTLLEYQATHKKCPLCSPPVTYTRPAGVQRRQFNYTKRGVTFKLEGYEHHALSWLVESKNIDITDIKKLRARYKPHGITYTFLNKTAKHFPDFYIKSQRKFIEVKSTYTAGLYELGSWKRKEGNIEITESVQFDTLKAKARACISKGFEYRVVIPFPNRNGEPPFICVLPKEFYKYSKSEVIALVVKHYSVFHF